MLLLFVELATHARSNLKRTCTRVNRRSTERYDDWHTFSKLDAQSKRWYFMLFSNSSFQKILKSSKIEVKIKSNDEKKRRTIIKTPKKDAQN